MSTFKNLFFLFCFPLPLLGSGVHFHPGQSQQYHVTQKFEWVGIQEMIDEKEPQIPELHASTDSEMWFRLTLLKAIPCPQVGIEVTRLKMSRKMVLGTQTLTETSFDSDEEIDSQRQSEEFLFVRRAFDQLKGGQMLFAYYGPFDVVEKSTLLIPREGEMMAPHVHQTVFGISRFSWRFFLTEFFRFFGKEINRGTRLPFYPMAYLDWGADNDEKTFAVPNERFNRGNITIQKLFAHSLKGMINGQDIFSFTEPTGELFMGKSATTGEFTINLQNGLDQHRTQRIELVSGINDRMRRVLLISNISQKWLPTSE